MPVTGSRSAALQLVVQKLASNQYFFQGKVSWGYTCQKTDFTDNILRSIRELAA